MITIDIHVSPQSDPSHGNNVLVLDDGITRLVFDGSDEEVVANVDLIVTELVALRGKALARAANKGA